MFVPRVAAKLAEALERADTAALEPGTVLQNRQGT
jgi:hypothetical protein